VSSPKETPQRFLSKEEIERLGWLRRELGQRILWGKLVESTLNDLQERMDYVAFTRTDFSRVIPFDQLFPEEQDFLEGVGDDGGETRMNLTVLYLVKKLLGALKTRVKKEIAQVRILSEVEIDQLKAKTELDETEEFSPAPVIEESRKLRSPERPRLLEISNIERPKSKEDLDLDGIVIHTSLTRTKSQECKHPRVTVQFLKGGVRREQCRLCNEILCEDGEKEKNTLKDNLPCEHPQAMWVPGQEGKVARCAEKSCGEIAPNPRKYRWSEAGLEEYGDDPSQDEVIVLGGGTKS
jgi:hypothetical protein